MTENVKPKNSYDHDKLMRFYNAITKSCGKEYDPLYLCCAYFQHAVDEETFLTATKILEMSETELDKMLGIK